MNYLNHYSEGNGNGRIAADASILASLTRELAHCCINKETELFSRFGLTSSEGAVLLTIADSDSSKPSAIACTLGLARSRLTPLSASLVDKGFLNRRESEKDRRVRELTLTDKGREVAAAAQNCRIDFHQRLLERYEEPEREKLLATLTTLHASMDELRRELNHDSLIVNSN